MEVTAKLFAPISYIEASPELIEAFVNGCGAGGWKFDLVPDTMYGLDISEACNIHDWMYSRGSTEKHKDEADRAFLNNLIRIVNSESKFFLLKWLRRKRAYAYYLAVSKFGGPAFWDDRNEIVGEQIEIKTRKQKESKV